MSDLIADFKRELRIVHGLADSTVNQYSFEVVRFLKYTRAKGKNELAVERGDFIDWREFIGTRRPSGLNVAIVAVRRFYHFLSRSGRIERSTFPEEMKVKIKQQTPTGVPTAKQFLDLRKKIADHQYRDLIEGLAGTGLRVSAIISLRHRHLHLGENPHIIVDSKMSCKGKTAGIVPITPYCASLFQRRMKYLSKKDRLFPISKSSAWRIVSSIKADGMKLKPHSLRHFYCAMIYYKNFDGNRFDVVWVRDALGHSSIAITDRYLKLAKQICRSDDEWEQWAFGKKGQANG